MEAGMSQGIACGACGATIEPFEMITVTGHGNRCYACYNRMIAGHLGVAFDGTPLQPIVMADADGSAHTFTIRSRLGATGLVMEAVEVTTAGRPVPRTASPRSCATARPTRSSMSSRSA